MATKHRRESNVSTTSTKAKSRQRQSPASAKAMHNVIDLFCGTGGFSLGMEKSHRGFRTIGAIDVLRCATDTCAANSRRAEVLCGDIRKIRPSSLERRLGTDDIAVIVGGPPCQGFSSLRPFRGSNDDDPRNSLFEQFASYVNYFRPQVFVLENVVGLLTHKHGKTIRLIASCFGQMGYSVDWRVLNAAHFGVPQKRERLFLIGRKDGGVVSFPKPTHHFSGRVIGYKNRDRLIVSDDSLPPAVTTMDAISDLPPLRSGEQVTRYRKSPQNAYQSERRSSSTSLTLHQAANHNESLLEVIKYAGDSISSIPSHLVTSGFSSCYSRLPANEPAATITVKFTSPASSKCIHPFQDRAITPREAARIQSFDDDFEFKGSKTDIACQIGNAVPPLLGRAIGGAILQMLREME
jgi:DNA (cytosine-5)-methyltransferase 1